MPKISLKNRIAYLYIISTALLTLLVFCVIYFIMKYSTYRAVDNGIKIETQQHLRGIVIEDGKIIPQHQFAWYENEHNTMELSPVFLQLMNRDGEVFLMSPNLNHKKLKLRKKKYFELFDTHVGKIAIRQMQAPVFYKQKQIGNLIVAMPLSDTAMVLKNLLRVLVIAYPLVLLSLFIIARFIAGRSIKPISTIIQTAGIITKDNLKSRIELPQQRDELYVLSQTINSLLDRIETAVEREKQFTSDASHELRTPLTILKGTLEVLGRKPRTYEEYQQKIGFCISEINRLDELIDQLLLLARFENQNQGLKKEQIDLSSVISETLSRFSNEIQSKNIQITTQLPKDYKVQTDSYLLTIILNNLISNALKFSDEKGELKINLIQSTNGIECQISDTGRGIPAKDLEKIFDQFYRSDSGDFPEVKGSGLGLSIVKKLCDLLHINIKVESKVNQGTTVSLLFSSKLTV